MIVVIAYHFSFIIYVFVIFIQLTSKIQERLKEVELLKGNDTPSFQGAEKATLVNSS